MNPTKNKRLYIVIIFNLLVSSLFAMEFWMPVIDGPWWQAASNPDLGQYTSDKQQPVDFALWQAADGTWQLWSCIRSTKLGGHTRLFYRWEGKQLTDTDWTPKGIAMMADPALGEPLGGLQAPHVVKFKGRYWMAYGDWDNMRLATSKDGKTFKRLTKAGVLFTEGPYVNNRDPMLIFTQDKWHCYYTAFPAERGYVYCRTSNDLLGWSEPVIAGYGGAAGNGPYSCECPHVVEVAPGHYFLFRTQYYGPGARTSVYHSQNPRLFGIDDDSGYVTQMNLCAPEIVQLDGRYYIAALNPDLDGIRIARLKWKSFTRPVFDFDSPVHRAQWKQTEGDLASVFTNSRRSWFGSQTEYFIATAETDPPAFDDRPVGILESPVFTIRTPDAIVYISGGNDLQRLYAAIVDAESDQEYLRVTGQNSNLLRPTLIDCRPFQSKPVKVRIADQSQESWGHINFGGLVEHTPEKDR